MIRHISALAAVIALSLSSVACAAAGETENEATEAAETSQDLVSQSAYFETFQGFDGRQYFHLMATNGENVLRSQGYSTVESARSGIESMLANGTDARNFDVRKAQGGDFYFNVKAANGEVIGTSEFYASKSSAERGARTVRALVRIARSDLRVRSAPRLETFEIFAGEDSKSYFRLRSNNGEILLASQGYTTSSSVKDGIKATQSNGSHAENFEIFESGDGASFGIRLVSANGEIVARGESYSTKASATRAVARISEILSGNIAITE